MSPAAPVTRTCRRAIPTSRERTRRRRAASRSHAGGAVLFNAQLWHFGGRNDTDQPRRAIFPYFGHYWIKRMDEFYRRPLPEYIVAHDDPLVRQLFGRGIAVASVHGGYDAVSYA